MKALPVLLVFALAIAASAAEPLTLEQCLAEAASTNPDRAAAKESLAKAEYQLRGSYGPLRPQVSANAGYNRSGGDSSTGGTFDTTRDTIGLSASQSFFSGGRNQAAVASAEANRRVAEDQLRIADAQLTFDVRQAFARLLYSQDAITLAEAIAKRRAENADLIQLRYESGKEHQGSLLRTQAAARDAQFQVEQARRANRVARRALARTLGRSETDPFAVTGSFATDAAPESPDLAGLAAATPKHRLAVAQVDAAKAAVRSAKSALWPELSGNASIGRNSETWPPEDDEWSLGVSLSVPLFSGGQNVNGVKGAKAEQRRAEESARSSDDQLVLDLEDAHASYQDAVERTQVQAQFLQAADVRAQIARAQYATGLISFQDWDTIENDLIDQQKNMLTARRDAVLAQAAWEQAEGLSRLP